MWFMFSKSFVHFLFLKKGIRCNIFKRFCAPSKSSWFLCTCSPPPQKQIICKVKAYAGEFSVWFVKHKSRKPWWEDGALGSAGKTEDLPGCLWDLKGGCDHSVSLDQSHLSLFPPFLSLSLSSLLLLRKKKKYCSFLKTNCWYQCHASPRLRS